MIRIICGFYLLISSCQAIVWHADQENAPQTEPEGSMRNIARVHYTKARVFGGCAVQLDKNWVLTAKHGVKIWKPKSLQIRIGEHRSNIKRIIRHPDPKTDLALLELETPIPVTEKLSLFTKKPPPKAKLWLGGYGKSGPAGKAGFPGKFAAGYNQLESVANHRGKMIFDKKAKDEVLPTRFDSGSPVFIQVGKNWQLLGITVTASNSKNPNYGDRSHHQLVAPVREWLEKTMH